MHLTQLLHRSVQQFPDDPAVVYQDRTRTFREVADRVARFASALRTLGVATGDRVAMYSLNSDRYIEYYYAVPWAGGVLNPVNIRWSPAEIAYSLRDSRTTVLLVDDMFAGSVPAIRAQYPELETVIHCGDGPTPEGMLNYEVLLAHAEPVADARRTSDDLAGVFYTGGTTGEPKGVMLSHRNLLTSAMGASATGYFMTGRRPRLLHTAPMFHLADFACWVSGSLAGGTHVVIPAFDPKVLLDAVERHQVTDVLLVPTMIQLLVDDPATAQRDLSSVEFIGYGASVISEAVLGRAMRTFPNADFGQAYGMTEVSPIATLLSPDDHRDPSLRRAAGRAAPHAEVRVVDPDDNEVPRGTVGEIVISGEHVMLGYWEKPAETAQALRGGWMHTGDGGYMDERGYIYVVDRIKDMIITGGENVYSAEVENVLAKHPAIAACAVIGVPDEQWGERVHAVVVPAEGATVTAEELREFAKQHVAGYKAPRSVEVVAALPMSGAGKVLKRELRAKYR
ncbi:acyl-CoA synthetase (AMP-forming)/AMP-acid ligase II [Tamaricihabitans halophyticus]|uniref:Acyl-CoA synthetase (AMP-forming)/AMP-acid ligase II n=1 Tax=Tamaricihabitans halophyticus TaxID=1262583 RepID=A0A4R2QQM6_9PSEU|nr:long-chain fatty acid--CoA ligase [Tamaricihabitans halophyticus]TCP51907.1 acyl-CoA synthetase (AMP-forming)/AMP-acid ligase II [Tamaricihabitans halophyticus]